MVNNESRPLCISVVGAEAFFEKRGDDIGARGWPVLMGEVAADHGGEDAEAGGGFELGVVGGHDGFHLGEGEVDHAAESGGGDGGVVGDAAVVFGDELGLAGLPAGEGARGDAKGGGDLDDGLAGEEEVDGQALAGGEFVENVGFGGWDGRMGVLGGGCLVGGGGV